MPNAINNLKTTEEYLTYDEGRAELIIKDLKDQADNGHYILSNWSINKKMKKDLEYYIVKVVKEFAKEKDLVAGE